MGKVTQEGPEECALPTMQIIFRKGGIREPAFRPKEEDFYLFPNSFHADDALLKPGAAARFSKVSACHL
jgi:hypothetical protein